jgi:hypothetical protein
VEWDGQLKYDAMISADFPPALQMMARRDRLC